MIALIAALKRAAIIFLFWWVMYKKIRILSKTLTSAGVIQAGDFVELPETEADALIKSGSGDGLAVQAASEHDSPAPIVETAKPKKQAKK